MKEEEKTENKMIKNTDIHIRLSSDEKQILKDYVEKSGHNHISLFFKFITNEYMALDKSGFELIENLTSLRREINSIGNNLNQISKRINSNSEYEDISNELREIKIINNKLNKHLKKIRPMRYSKNRVKEDDN
ncbi:plasmid mobilization protein [Acetobacter thailandicus]|uniref:plasmid mobilization protein n=1 Tax=Acetobacter thailandicus TaxID=1502842 RepID=UPI001BA9280A|nr:plasmid mobilization relaxosome protein MobC [Acetobacter thailandicus]MBS0980820.1 plasmid mobilization relaxosome protein MobC [Acetobacter thailandicus]